MTDNEIIKAMQCVMGNDVSCSECEYQKVLPFPSCRNMCAKNALDLINRQKEEIEKLQVSGKEAVSCFTRMESLYKIKCKELEVAKSEAIKAFARRLKCGVPQETGVIRCADIDNLVKEMTEEEK